jgi:hypothetical protein
MANLEYTYTFKGVEYLIYLSAREQTLRIDLENPLEGCYWKNEYESHKLEEIAEKTQSYKKFNVILKMIVMALSKESDSLICELLSYKDLEAIKQKRSGINNTTLNESQSVDPNKINQKYLVITYVSDFEKWNFPLTLNYQNEPDSESLFRTIERLKKNNKSGSGGGGLINLKEIEEVKQENVGLKNKIKLLESQRKFGAVDNDESLRNYTVLKDEYEAYKTQADSKIKLLSKTVEDLKVGFTHSDHSQAENNEKYIKIITELENRLKKAEDILIKERREGQQYIDEKNKDIEKAMKEVNYYKENEKKLNVKIKQLEKELDYQVKRSIYNPNMSRTKNSFKSNMSYNSSVRSETSNASKSSLKKDLLANPYNKFKGLNSKNYSPFRVGSNTKSVTSNKSATKSISSKISYTSNFSKPKSLYSNSSSKQSSKRSLGTNLSHIPKKTITNPIKSTVSKYYQPKTTAKPAAKPVYNKPVSKVLTTTTSTTDNDIQARLGRIQRLLDTAKS